MKKSYYKSPIGILEIICKDNQLISLKPVSSVKACGKDNDFIKSVKSRLDEYFRGERRNFDIKINPSGTDFQKKVWLQLQQIPYGVTWSYFEVGKAIGNKNAQRAVGSACNKNPIMIVIPCHRVISKNGDLGGFAYGNLLKHALLKIENAPI